MFKKPDPLLHNPVRLAVMAHLVARQKSDFKELRKITGATAGNLSVQLKKLEAAGMLRIHKGYKNNYPHTSVELTSRGLNAFEDYVRVMSDYLNAVRRTPPGSE